MEKRVYMLDGPIASYEGMKGYMAGYKRYKLHFEGGVKNFGSFKEMTDWMGDRIWKDWVK